MGYALLPLLLNDRVQRELAIRGDQRQSLAALEQSYSAELSVELRVAQAAPTGGTQAALTAFRAKQSRLLADSSRAAENLLTAAQQRRLDQVLLRLRSIEVYDIPEIASALALTDDQRLAIRKVRVELEGAARQLHMERAAEKLARADFDRAVDDLFRSAEAQVMPLLNSAQREQIHALRGPSIPFTRQSLRLEIRGAAERRVDPAAK
jgi:hypothetical protein